MGIKAPYPPKGPYDLVLTGCRKDFAVLFGARAGRTTAENDYQDPPCSLK